MAIDEIWRLLMIDGHEGHEGVWVAGQVSFQSCLKGKITDHKARGASSSIKARLGKTGASQRSDGLVVSNNTCFIILFKPFWDDAFHFFATYLNWLVFSVKPLTSRAWGHFGFCRVQVNTSKTPDFDQAIWAFFAMAIHGELHQVSQPHKQCSKPLLVDDCGILLPNILWIIII